MLAKGDSMRRALVTLALATAALAAAVPSLAQVDVELAFSPDTAGPGTAVTLFASIANHGRAVASGLYFYRVQAGRDARVGKIVPIH